VGPRWWLTEARRRADRVSDRYRWVSAYIVLAQLEVAVATGAGDASTVAARLHDSAIRADLPEFLAWALVYQAELGDVSRIALARTAAVAVDNPALHGRVDTLGMR
jgi:hypothetical protein